MHKAIIWPGLAPYAVVHIDRPYIPLSRHSSRHDAVRAARIKDGAPVYPSYVAMPR